MTVCLFNVDTKITLACRHYDGTSAILRGGLRLPGVDLRVFEVNDVVRMFRGMFKGEYDVAEMSLAELVYYTSRDRCDFIGIPVFPSRMFRHSFVYTSSGIHQPEDLSGKRIGFLRWVQTAHIWVRGMLVETYHLSPIETHWYVCSIHHWEDEESEEIQPRDGSVIRRLQWRGENEYEAACRALKENNLDALVTTENQLYDNCLDGDGNIKRLFSDYREVEGAYFRRTGIFPIMHVLVVKKALIAQLPDLPQQLFRMFSEAKKLGRQWTRTVPSMNLVWKTVYLEKEAETLGEDPWVYGLERNRNTIQKFLDYCHNQGISAKPLSPADLFAPGSWNLTE